MRYPIVSDSDFMELWFSADAPDPKTALINEATRIISEFGCPEEFRVDPAGVKGDWTPIKTLEIQTTDGDGGWKCDFTLTIPMYEDDWFK